MTARTPSDSVSSHRSRSRRLSRRGSRQIRTRRALASTVHCAPEAMDAPDATAPTSDDRSGPGAPPEQTDSQAPAQPRQSDSLIRPKAGSPQRPAALCWSYFTHTIDVSGTLAPGHLDPARVNRVLDELGADGWELVSSYGTGNVRGTHTLVFIFKRPA